MAHQKKLDQWILSISNKMDLRATTLNWSEQYFTDLNDIDVSLIFQNKKYVTSAGRRQFFEVFPLK